MDVLGIKFEATGSQEFAENARKTAEALNRQEKTDERLLKWRREMAKLARDEREANFKKLSDAKQLERLLQRQAELTERIARAEGNAVRSSALRLQLARTNAQIRDTRGRGTGLPGGGGTNVSGLLGRIPGVGGAQSLVSDLGVGAGAGAAALVAAGMALLTNRAVKAAQAVSDLSDKSSISRGNLQALAYASEATTTDLGALTDVYKQFAQRQGEVNAGLARSKLTFEAFKTLGISMEDLRRSKPEDILAALSRRFQDGAVSAEELAAGVKLMGDNFREFLLAAKQGHADFVKDFKDNNRAISEGTLDVLNNMGDAWDEFWAKLKQGGKKFGSEFAADTVEAVNTAMAGLAQLFGRGDIAEELLKGKAERSIGGTGERDVAANEKALKDAQNARESRNKIGSEISRIRSIGGDDAEDVIAELGERGAKPADYQKAGDQMARQSLKRIHKAEKDILHKAGKQRGWGIISNLMLSGSGAEAYENAAAGIEQQHGGGGPNVAASQSDPLARVGLFVGGANPYKTALETQTRELKKSIEDVTRAIEKFEATSNDMSGVY